MLFAAARRSRAFAFLLCAGLGTSCGLAPRSAPPEIARALELVDGTTARAATWEEMCDRLAEQDVVYFGESHDDQVTHALELAVLEELCRRRGGDVVLALEMFERDQQAVLDDYVARRIDEAQLYAATRTWGNYRAGYRPLIELARKRGLRIVAANAPAAARRKVSSGGLESLDAAERAWVASELLPNSDAYWERFDAVMAGHGGGGAPKPTAEERLRCGQSVWDNTMGESVARALEAQPGCVVMLVVGRFHVERDQGTAEQVSLRRRGTRAMTLIAETVERLEEVDLTSARGVGTWVAFVERRERVRSDEQHALRLDGELRYALHVPKGATSPLPTLVWLPREGERAADAQARWRAEIGEQAALVVVEGPMPIERVDLARGSGWTHPEHSEDREEQRERLVAALAGALRALPESYPVDPAHLVLGGAGEGAVIAQAVRSKLPQARLLEGENVREALGLEERASTGEIALLLEEPDAPLARAWAEIYAAARAEDRTRAHRVVLHAGLAALPAGTAVRPLHVAGAGYAEALRSIHPELDVREAFGPEDLANGRALPLASGVFGGTTVLVVPGSPDEAQRAAWIALETEKAIAQRSSTARLKVCFEAGQPTLAEALSELAGAGKKSALVVPAVFAADAAAMQALRASAGAAAAKLELSWLPGLGAELWRARA